MERTRDSEGERDQWKIRKVGEKNERDARTHTRMGRWEETRSRRSGGAIVTKV